MTEVIRDYRVPSIKKSKDKQKPLSIVRTVRDTLMSDMLDFRGIMQNKIFIL